MSLKIPAVKNWIVNSIEEISCCQDVADHLGVKLETLSRRFVQYKGPTLLQYIKKVKMEQAKKLLRSDNIRCCEIASRLKLGSPQYAARVFKRRFGMTMTDYFKRQGPILAIEPCQKVQLFLLAFD